MSWAAEERVRAAEQGGLLAQAILWGWVSAAFLAHLPLRVSVRRETEGLSWPLIVSNAPNLIPLAMVSGRPGPHNIKRTQIWSWDGMKSNEMITLSLLPSVRSWKTLDLDGLSILRRGEYIDPRILSDFVIGENFLNKIQQSIKSNLIN